MLVRLSVLVDLPKDSSNIEDRLTLVRLELAADDGHHTQIGVAQGVLSPGEHTNVLALDCFYSGAETDPARRNRILTTCERVFTEAINVSLGDDYDIYGLCQEDLDPEFLGLDKPVRLFTHLPDDVVEAALLPYCPQPNSPKREDEPPHYHIEVWGPLADFSAYAGKGDEVDPEDLLPKELAEQILGCFYTAPGFGWKVRGITSIKAAKSTAQPHVFRAVGYVIEADLVPPPGMARNKTWAAYKANVTSKLEAGEYVRQPTLGRDGLNAQWRLVPKKTASAA